MSGLSSPHNCNKSAIQKNPVLQAIFIAEICTSTIKQLLHNSCRLIISTESRSLQNKAVCTTAVRLLYNYNNTAIQSLYCSCTDCFSSVQ